MRLRVLGGTSFLGRHVATAALGRGRTVRGERRPLGHLDQPRGEVTGVDEVRLLAVTDDQVT